ncbi:peptidoglycan-binding LysM [Gottschalkia purinilytica]|uniref:Peptidoglycan-binding LysM n=1 Tax=Gottschalkia purinilytica TaxID=1503 RepID=A0A0L0W7U9_GOTPU|nr:LysM peptidoglycan-binding domain-containing protein [Gottschalkia purinilytica]KNF07375.1 peptidoglycan-binding LysM [Gottschalkia purinilytica]
MSEITCPRGTVKYRVKRGDTLTSIARAFNVPPFLIVLFNPNINPNYLSIGQELCIPRLEPITCPSGRYYTVRRGDNFYTISRQFGLTVRELRAANPNVNPYALVVGQRLCIPTRPPVRRCPEGTRTYEIKRGDTFYSIAIRFNVSYSELTNLNPNIDPNNLRVGQIICIPIPPPSIPCPSGRSYVIKPGDTLTSIAENFVVSVGDLLRANPNLSPSDFVPGRRICIPRSVQV